MMSSGKGIKLKKVTSRQTSTSPSTISTISRKSSKQRDHSLQTTENSASSDIAASELKFFPRRQIQDIMLQALNTSKFAEIHQYDPRSSVDGVLEISDTIRNKVKIFLQRNAHERYKIVVNVLAGSTNAADMAFVSRSVWDTNTDTFVEAKLNLGEKYLIAVLYAVEQE